MSIKNYEVAGIALNGTNNGILSDIVIKNNNKDIKIRSTYSQARFIRNFINIVSTHNNDIKLNIQGIEKTFNNIHSVGPFSSDAFFLSGKYVSEMVLPPSNL